MKWLLRVVGLLVGLYAVLFATVLTAMTASTGAVRDGDALHADAARVGAAARSAHLDVGPQGDSPTEGMPAPDFNLSTLDGKSPRVALSSHRGVRPVVLVFGSYT